MTTCESCRWWVRDTESEEGEGNCHRYPPVPVKADFEVEGEWPKTKADDWCGEHR